VASTYEPIANATGTGSSGQVTFSSIPGTYTDLILVTHYIDVQIDNLGLRFNSDSGSNYSRTSMYGTGSSRSSSKNSNQTYAYTMYKDTNTTTDPVYATTQIMNYSSSATYKNLINRTGTKSGSTYNVFLQTLVWRSNNAITQIDIYSGNANFSTNCKWTLFGVKAA